MLLYLTVSEHVVSAILVREEGSKQLLVYYVSKSFLDVETRYSHLEKLALALVVASQKLRPYFQAHQIVVVTSFPIKTVLHKPEVSGRLDKWVVELGEYDVVFRPASAIKSQVWPTSWPGSLPLCSQLCGKKSNFRARRERLESGLYTWMAPVMFEAQEWE